MEHLAPLSLMLDKCFLQSKDFERCSKKKSHVKGQYALCWSPEDALL